MTVKVIVFDFDGTIADTHDAFVEIVNHLSEEFGYAKITPEDLETLKILSAREIVDSSNISPLKIPCILRRIKLELNKRISHLNLIQGIDEYLACLKKEGYELGIITSNSKDNVMLFLKKHDLDDLFDFIYAGTTLFGKHHIIKHILGQKRLKPDELIYVGDEVRDITAAQKSRVKMIAVAWGFNSPVILAQYQPDCLIEHPQDLLAAIAPLK
jgi:phosphoglycolate phosphatase